MFTLNNFRHAGIVTLDLDRALKFYMGILGMKEVNRGQLDQYDVLKFLRILDTKLLYVKLKTENSNTLLELYYFPSPKEETLINETPENIADTQIFHHISFTVSNIDELYHRLIEEEIECYTEPSIDVECKHKLFFCRDFDGNLIEFVEVL